MITERVGGFTAKIEKLNIKLQFPNYLPAIEENIYHHLYA